MNKYYPFTSDYVFSAILRNNKELAKGLLEIIMSCEIASIEYIEIQKTGNYGPDLKFIRFDVYLKDDKNTHYNIELQVGHYAGLPKRIRFYRAVSDAEMIRSGTDYEDIPDLYTIFICTDDPFGLGLARYDLQVMCKQDPEMKYNEGAYIIIFNAKGRYDDLTPRQKKLLQYISTGNPSDDPVLGMIQTKVDELNRDPSWRNRVMTFEEKIRLERKEAEKLGIEQGIEQGKELEKRENIKQIYSFFINKGSSHEQAVKDISVIHNLSFKEIEQFLEDQA